MYSTASGQKKHWYEKNPIKHLKEKHSSGASHLGTKHGSEPGYSMSQSMSSLFPSKQGNLNKKYLVILCILL